jgi:hypothetical protein
LGREWDRTRISIMKLFKNDFFRSFAIGFGAAAVLVAAVMHHGPAGAVRRSLMPQAQAADSSPR